jgi:hypothetical protein
VSHDRHRILSLSPNYRDLVDDIQVNILESRRRITEEHILFSLRIIASRVDGRSLRPRDAASAFNECHIKSEAATHFDANTI